MVRGPSLFCGRFSSPGGENLPETWPQVVGRRWKPTPRTAWMVTVAPRLVSFWRRRLTTEWMCEPWPRCSLPQTAWCRRWYVQIRPGSVDQAVQEVVLQPGQRHLAVLPADHAAVDVQAQLGDRLGFTHRLHPALRGRCHGRHFRYGGCRADRGARGDRDARELQEGAGLVGVRDQEQRVGAAQQTGQVYSFGRGRGHADDQRRIGRPLDRHHKLAPPSRTGPP